MFWGYKLSLFGNNTTLQSLLFEDSLLAIAADRVLGVTSDELGPDLARNKNDEACDEQGDRNVGQPEQSTVLGLKILRLTEIFFVIIDAFFSTQTAFDHICVALVSQENVLLFNSNDLVHNTLLEHEILNSLLVVNKVEVLAHELEFLLISVRFDQVMHFVAAAASLLEASDQLSGLRTRQLSERAALGYTAWGAERTIIDRLFNLHLHILIHTEPLV